MTTRRRTPHHVPTTHRIPATTPEARENQLIESAVNLAERQLEEGTASAQVITHYLKLGSSREKLEQERLANENILLRAKKEAMDSHTRIEKLYGDALSAMRAYNGQPPQESIELDDEDQDVY